MAARSEAQWVPASKKVLEDASIDKHRDLSAWRGDSKLPGVPNTARIMNLLDVARACSQSQDLYVDISQSVGRRPWSAGTLRSITTGSNFFSFKRRRTLEVQELWRCFGFADKNIPSASPHALRNLLGEAMSLPCIALAMVSVLEQVAAAGMV